MSNHSSVGRLELLKMLVEMSRPTTLLLEDLRSYGWDFDGRPFILSSNHVMNVIQRYLKGEIDSCEVEEWANAVEGREDLEYESNHQDELSVVIYELANPYLTEPLTSVRAKALMGLLMGSPISRPGSSE